MIDYKSMPKSEKYSQFVCAELNNCADTIRDIDGTLYCNNPNCHCFGKCNWCDNYILAFSLCERCCYEED